ncbi:hypothetical protein Salat_1740300 [Sesamum alatum]|uniref:Uncharacterized protein n=1 Tax=Sesamum alatum TaxID=300844 RepID=A0AAE2CKF9_9LAMI|nr:hypothetical protein Salat_1740300 [Sesamum alatum]
MRPLVLEHNTTLNTRLANHQPAICTSRTLPIPTGMKVFRSRTITNIRYIDNEVLNVLGISYNVEYSFARLGWHDFMFTRWPIIYMTLAEFNEILGFPIGGEWREPPAFKPDKFWRSTWGRFGISLEGLEEAKGINLASIDGCLVDLISMPLPLTPCSGFLISSNNSSTGKQSSVIDKHNSKILSTIWSTSSNACTIGL